MQTIVAMMEANVATFPSPSPSLSDVRLHIKELADLQAAFVNRVSPSVPRDAAFTLLMEDGRRLCTCVQERATANPEQAAVIAGQAAMTLRPTPGRHKPPLAVKQTLSTEVKLIGRAIKHAGMYGWQCSIDGGLTWIDLPPTTQASTPVKGLQPAVMTSFRYRILTKDGWGDWSQPVSHLVS